VEHPSERRKHYKMMPQFIRSGRGIAFGRMFAMTGYPPDMMPLYSQGYTLAEFLIQRGGRRKFVDFLADGIETGTWSAATKRHYGIADVASLQKAWLAWVGQGFPRIQRPDREPGALPSPEMLAAGGRRPRPEPNLIYRIDREDRTGGAAEELAGVTGPNRSGATPGRPTTSGTRLAAASVPAPKVLPASGWYPVGERPAQASVAVAVAVEPAPAEPVRTQVTRPQPIQRARQVIVRWQGP
jgi:hypothetical protein